MLHRKRQLVEDTLVDFNFQKKAARIGQPLKDSH